MEIADKIAIAAFATSFVSLILASFSFLLSKKALRLSEKDHAEKTLGIKPYLIDCFTFSVNNKRYCEFAISITNLSSATKSFSNIEMHVEYTFEDGECGSAISQPISNIHPPNIQEDYKKLDVPINIQPKETVSGWVTFLQPKNESIEFRIKEYKIVGICDQGTIHIVTAYLLRFMKNEEK